MIRILSDYKLVKIPLSFALLRCAILCIRGSRSSAHHPALGPLGLSVVLAESRLTNSLFKSSLKEQFYHTIFFTLFFVLFIG